MHGDAHPYVKWSSAIEEQRVTERERDIQMN